ncbi:hypothetical protein BTURTLESOX_114 [bacterium endosymbiont of Bathymodiolus sp. 5 South]|nr:hypothetical protein [uncultured Gammaproteobacteria bacterium]SHN90243.1 hypothetical protein BCLUESOX_294 [bacterium endosymbiont of Bathymodiolus sp. 5 South]CAC9635974.1 hypothetical protein [uncultured Gammaproteobacteria bacterium]SSC09160.1 hypothetical protein BTURTLESOX_114 [bacterium endosymbiont of Bathymodiolus sp. 5 South]VVH55495.1 hypothetical protein BSPCLSOX_302 [uncultured Gammaproteobacteria bacterium]
MCFQISPLPVMFYFLNQSFSNAKILQSLIKHLAKEKT